MKPLHIVFGLSACGSLRVAVAMAGRDEEVIGFPDSLEFGPIDPPDLALRARWIEEEIGSDDWEDFMTPQLQQFWRAALDDGRQRYVWLSRRSASHYCAFLEWVRRNGDKPFLLIDLTDHRVPNRADPAETEVCPVLSAIPAEDFVALGLWDLAQPADSRRMTEWRDLWRRLQVENAPVRIIVADGLVSAPITVFDDQLLSYAKHEAWRVVASIVGTFLADTQWLDNDRRCPVWQTGDIFPIARLYELIDRGVLESRGDESSIQRLFVRKPA